MILVDTSIWVDHFRAADSQLVQLLQQRAVLSHPFVVGELAMGNVQDRAMVLRFLGNLPMLRAAANDEVMAFVERMKLFGRGIGLVDAHLLAALRLAPGNLIWTRDRRLAEAAATLGLAFRP